MAEDVFVDLYIGQMEAGGESIACSKMDVGSSSLRCVCTLPSKLVELVMSDGTR